MENCPNAVFIALDTLRADHMSCYGYELDTTPNVDRSAEESVLSEGCIPPGIPTHPAYTMFTGVHPLRYFESVGGKMTRLISYLHGGRAESFNARAGTPSHVCPFIKHLARAVLWNLES